MATLFLGASSNVINRPSNSAIALNLYAQGGHGFALRRTKFPITEWPRLVETWLGTIGMISKEI